MQERPTILVVDTDLIGGSSLRAELQQAGFETVHATSFEAAKDLLTTMRPAILIADVRLGAFNGLHLLLRARMREPDLVGIITSSVPDPVLQAETSRLGGTFLVKPVDLSELLAVIFQASQSLSSEGLAVAPPWNSVERRVFERRQVMTPGFAPDRRVDDRRNR